MDSDDKTSKPSGLDKGNDSHESNHNKKPSNNVDKNKGPDSNKSGSHAGADEFKSGAKGLGSDRDHSNEAKPSSGIKGLMADNDDSEPKPKNSKSGNDDSILNLKDGLKKLKKNNPIRRVNQATTVGGGAAGGYLALQLARLIAFLKMMFAKALAMVHGLIASIMHVVTTIVSAVATALSIGAVAATMIVGGGAALFAVAVVTSVAMLVSNNSARTDAIANACVPASVRIPDDVADNTDQNANENENIKKAWSVLKTAGANEKVAGAILGSWSIESGIDPTGVETIYDEKYTIGSRKHQAEKADFKISAIDSVYASRYPAIEYAGIGLGQWTNGRNVALRNYAKDKKQDWFDIGTQLGFMLSKDDPSRVETLKNLINNKTISIDDASQQFLVKWEGNPGDKLDARKAEAGRIAVQLKDMAVDSKYAESILNDVNMDNSSSNHDTGEKLKDDGCGDTVDSHYDKASSDIVKNARKYLGYFSYYLDHSLSSFKDWDNPPKDALTDCSGFIWFALHKSGYSVPENMGWYTGSMEADAKGDHKWLKEISKKDAKAGDVVIVNTGNGSGSNGHTAILTGDYAGGNTPIIEQGGIGDSVNESTYNMSFLSLLQQSHTEVFARPVKAAANNAK